MPRIQHFDLMSMTSVALRLCCSRRGGLGAGADVQAPVRKESRRVTTVVVWVLVVVFAFTAFAKSMSSINRGTAKGYGRNRCKVCRSRLRSVNGSRAKTCRKCGARQSWT